MKKNMSRTHRVVKGRRQQAVGEADLLPGYMLKALTFYFVFPTNCYLLFSVSDNTEVIGSAAI